MRCEGVRRNRLGQADDLAVVGQLVVKEDGASCQAAVQIVIKRHQ